MDGRREASLFINDYVMNGMTCEHQIDFFRGEAMEVADALIT